MRPPKPLITVREIVLVLVATAAALLVREWIRRHFVADAVDPALAKHLSFLLCVPVWLALSAPVLATHRRYVAAILRFESGTARLILLGIAVGVACRVLWWAQATLFGALDLSGTAGDPGTFSWSFGCPPLTVFATGLVTMALVTPLIEELIHRGLIQTYFDRFGAPAGILVSAFIFTVFHETGNWPIVFLLGTMLAIQFRGSATLWFPIATHATYNGLIQFDWVCVSLEWQPAKSDVPSLPLIALSLLAGMAALVAIVHTLRIAQKRR